MPQINPECLRSFFLSFFKISSGLKKGGKRSNLIVHGDTVSTLIGAIVGRLKGFRVCHVEGGLRSFNWLHPFPEELDRVVVSRFAHVHFCPNPWAVKNVKHLAGEKIDTGGNTLIDSLHLSAHRGASAMISAVSGHEKYFILVVHRQENLMNKEFLKFVISVVSQKMRSLKCVFVLHKTTKDALNKFGLMSMVEANPHFVCTERLPYFSFMALLKAAQFIVTDGGSNQEECSYLGLPTLILRKVTERTEGLGNNVVLYDGRLESIAEFFDSVESLRRPPIVCEHSPSARICQWLLEN